jgi:hypothetical protein
MSELVASAAHDELMILPRGKVRLHGIDFDEDFLSELVARHFWRQKRQTKLNRPGAIQTEGVAQQPI